MVRRWSGAAATAAALAALLCLAGCQALGLPGAAPTSPRATSAPALDVAPPLDCAAFTPADAVEALLGGSAPLATTPADALITPAGLGPFGVQATGGGWCRWGDDPGAPDPAATSTAVHLLSVRLLPRAGASWQALAQRYPQSAAMGAHYDGGESRGGDCAAATTGTTGSSCHTNVLVGGSWLAVDAISSTSTIDEKAFHALVQSFVPTVATLDARTPTPAPAKVLSCGDAAWLKAVAGVYGPSSVAVLDPAGTFGVQSALVADPAVTVCAYRAGSGDSALLGTVSVLRGASAAFATYHGLVVSRDPDASGGTIQVGGTEVATLVRHTDASGSTPAETVVDAQVGDAWIQFAALSGSDDQASSVVEWVAGRL